MAIATFSTFSCFAFFKILNQYQRVMSYLRYSFLTNLLEVLKRWIEMHQPFHSWNIANTAWDHVSSIKEINKQCVISITKYHFEDIMVDPGE